MFTSSHATADAAGQSTSAVSGRSESPRVVFVPHAGAEARIDRWLAHELRPRARATFAGRPHTVPSPFERVISGWLAADGLRRAELEKLADLVINGHAGNMQRVLFVSLARELDISRILVGASIVAQANTNTLLVDGDLRSRTLSVLLQQQGEPGLGEVLNGKLLPDDVVVPLNTPGAAVVPAGLVGRGASAKTSPILVSWRPNASLLVDGGLWPVPNLSTLLAFTDHVFAVVRVDETRWSDFNQLRRVLTSQDRRLDGCLVAGDFE